MATMNVSLPDQMREWVEMQVGTGRYANASDYVRDLIRRDQGMLARLQEVVDDALASGVVEMSSADLLEDIKRRGREKILAVAGEIRREAVKADDAA